MIEKNYNPVSSIKEIGALVPMVVEQTSRVKDRMIFIQGS